MMLNGNFLVLGKKGSGKSVLLQKMDGSYVPNYMSNCTSTDYCDLENYRGKGEIDISDILSGFSVPSVMRDHLFENPNKIGESGSNIIKTKLNIKMKEISPIEGDITSSLADFVHSSSHFQKQASSVFTHQGGERKNKVNHLDISCENSPRDTGEEHCITLNGLPQEHHICGLIWIIRNNCLIMCKELVLEKMREMLSEDIRNHEIQLPDKKSEHIHDPSKWNADMDLKPKWEKEMIDMFKQEFVLYMQESHNDVLSMCNVPMFSGLPIVFVLNNSNSVYESMLDSMVRDLLSHSQLIMADMISVDEKIQTNLISPEEIGPLENECIKGAEVEFQPLGELLKYILKKAFSTTSTIGTFSKFFDMEGLEKKIGPPRKVHQQANWYPNVDFYNIFGHRKGDSKRSDIDQNCRENQYLESIMKWAASGPCLEIFLLRDGAKFGRDNAGYGDSNKIYAGDRSDVYDEVEVLEKSGLICKGKPIPEHYIEFLKTNASNAKECLSLSRFQIRIPKPVSLAIASLGNESNEEECLTSDKKKRVYMFYRDKEKLFVDPNFGEYRIPDVQLECYLYNWMLDVLAWNLETSKCSKSFFCIEHPDTRDIK